MRKKVVAGNWKMNLSGKEASALVSEIVNSSSDVQNVELIVFPPAVYLQKLSDDFSSFNIGAQNFHPEEKGAFTGEISVKHIQDCGLKYVLVGHSERRELFNESHDFLKNKVDSALNHFLTPVFCCGEPLEVREAHNEFQYVKNQLESSLFHLSKASIMKCFIAYEPVWAIGTGKTATSLQAEEMHSAIRSWIKEKYDDETAEMIPILYGGSCNPSNANELFACENVDGGLIGGASLQAESFISIAKSF